MMHIHKLMNATTNLTFTLCACLYLYFKFTPSLLISLIRITTLPIRVILAMKSVYFPPFCRAWVRTEIILNAFSKITSCSFKLFTAKGAILSYSISRSSPFCWTCMVALDRAVLAIITNKAFKFFFAYCTWLNLFSCEVLSSFSHTINLHNIIEIDKDYFEASEKRFQNHIAQLTMF